jgi:hypothetical protein
MFGLCNSCVLITHVQLEFLVMHLLVNGIYLTAMRLSAIIFAFRSNRRRSLSPFIILRKPSAATYSPWVSEPERMFSHSALPQNPSSGPEAGGHPESAKPEARCLCRQQRRVTNTSEDQGVGRSVFLDAALAAFMGIGIGELQFY